jgi:tetratricopeptide (TPR) repeat protein
MVNKSYNTGYKMLQVSLYVLRVLAVAIVSGSILPYRAYSIPLNSSALIASTANSAKTFYYSAQKKHFINKDYKGAIADYTRVIQINPKFPNIYTLRADAKMWSGDYKGAIADLTEAIRINPKDTNAYESRGVIKAGSGDKQGGIKDLQEAARRYQKEGKTSNYKNVQIIIKTIEERS